MKFVLYIVFVLYFQIVGRDAAAYVATRWLCYVRLCHKQKTELQRQKAESSSVYILTQGGGGGDVETTRPSIPSGQFTESASLHLD